MAKVYATFEITGDKWKLVAGPNADYKGQRAKITKAREEGTGKADELVMVDLKSANTKKARGRRLEDVARRQSERATYRAKVAADAVAAKKAAQKEAESGLIATKKQKAKAVVPAEPEPATA